MTASSLVSKGNVLIAGLISTVYGYFHVLLRKELEDARTTIDHLRLQSTNTKNVEATSSAGFCPEFSTPNNGYSLLVDPSLLNHQPSAPSYVLNNDRIIEVNGKQLTADDILFGYDKLFEADKLFLRSRWLGTLTSQDPLDAWMIQEILWDLRPELVIETGTFNGGGAVFYASIMRYYNPESKVITIDPRSFQTPEAVYNGHYNTVPADCLPFAKEMVTFLQGYPDHDETKAEVHRLMAQWNVTKVMLIEDSHHKYQMVLDNVNAYKDLVPKDGYILVQDTKMDRFQNRAGPRKAVYDWLETNPDFEMDRSYEQLFYYSQHVQGLLKRTNRQATSS
eukprot:CAMPEP_0183736142 /NCGR_PEP_ID=MMETSP0737-20130205/48602_1 /TAXON_ID=385413 /ORGANISM="Thalassiosira miniscula, Strain CCMP1093" /LENGTH=335 /DNA_ID=CAMNT_0025970075 /DNA_START=147 /DNA_END=1154 /DNA_ORIENTATION=-